VALEKSEYSEKQLVLFLLGKFNLSIIARQQVLNTDQRKRALINIRQQNLLPGLGMQPEQPAINTLPGPQVNQLINPPHKILMKLEQLHFG
jgi:hypothetical protein